MEITGKVAPIDAEPSPRGNIFIGSETAQVLSQDEIPAHREQGDKLYLSHFASCPNSKMHRKPK